MNVRAIKTDRITAGNVTLSEFLDKHLYDVKEASVVAVTSKVVAILEGRVVPIGSVEKQQLVEQESDYYLPRTISNYGYSFTITHHTLVPLAGIDESNGNGDYILWPAEPQDSANEIRGYLQKKFGLKKIGVVITDSTARPLHYGTEGVAIGYSGFSPSNDYVGKPDLFGRPFKVSISNVLDALASAAVVVMGEGTEQTPIAIIEDLPFVNFQDHNPTPQEVKAFYLEHMDDDLFAPFLQNMGWIKGRRGKSK